MKDERKPCASCGHEHAYGTLRYSVDNVPLRGARKCWCGCDHFIEPFPEAAADSVPALTQDQTVALWSRTSFLNAQVPAATRMAMAGIMNLLELATTDLPSPSIIAAVREFMGLMISQVTDIRGALVRDDNKFAHLVAHTDEIIESMRAVSQLADRLTNIYGAISQIQQQQQKTERDIAGIAAVLAKAFPGSVEIRAADADYPHIDDPEERPEPTNGRLFVEKTASLRDEPVVIEPETED